MPLASWPARANRKVQTIPIRPLVCAAGLPPGCPCRVWEHDSPSTPLGVVTLGYCDQLVEVEAMAAVTGVSPQPAGTSPDRRAAAIMTTFQPPTIMAATTSALPARIDHSAQLRNGRTRYLRGRILGRAWVQNAA